MKRLLQPFVLVVTALLAVGYAYLAARLTSGPWGGGMLAIPFFLIWIVPVFYWARDRDGEESWLDQAAHQASYLSMAWVSFALVLTLVRDVALLFTSALALAPVRAAVEQDGVLAVLVGSLVALAIGALTALRGPGVKEVELHIPGLHPDLDGFRIVQVSDLHVGRNIRRAYVERAVARAHELAPDLVALTGDMVDGPVERLARHVAPLAALAHDDRAFFVLGNHDCYSGASAWLAHFRGMGMRVLLNEHTVVRKGAATLVVGGVVDPAYRLQRPEISLEGAPSADFRLLLAHNPKLAPLGARAGFDLQLSGHTHAGQFFPWTLAVRLVHAPHVAGLSREGRMWVYVSAGTGTWGPPVRFGTRPEVTLIKLAATERAVEPTRSRAQTSRRPRSLRTAPRARRSGYLVATLACAMLFGCAQIEHVPEPLPAEPASTVPPAPAPGAPSGGATSQQRGQISLYGKEFAGKKTASGEPFDPASLTMAHRTLPFGTRVRVTNLENQRSVEVVVNDRGPFIPGRIADLSEAAARRIGMVADGVVEALLEVL